MKKILPALLFILAATAGAAEFTIVKAVYGSPDKNADVTENLRKKAVIIPGVCLAFIADNATLGADPAPGALKHLTLTYTEDGVEKTLRTRERRHCVILPGAAAQEEFRIFGAYYGGGTKWNDVTEKVRDANVNAAVDNNNFGPDPVSGKPKSLIILYSWKNELKMIRYSERQIFKRDFPR